MCYIKQKGGNMKPEFVKIDSIYHPGYGAGGGTIVKEYYTCACGKGYVIVTKDKIPGFREKDAFIDCDMCAKKFKVEFQSSILHLVNIGDTHEY